MLPATLMFAKTLTDAERSRVQKYVTEHGWKFVGRLDGSGTILVVPTEPVETFTPELLNKLANAVAEYAGMFAIEVYPKLNGFAGFDLMHFVVQNNSDEVKIMLDNIPKA